MHLTSKKHKYMEYRQWLQNILPFSQIDTDNSIVVI